MSGELLADAQQSLAAYEPATNAQPMVNVLLSSIASWLDAGGEPSTLETILNETPMEAKRGPVTVTELDLTGGPKYRARDIIVRIPAMGLPLLVFVNQDGSPARFAGYALPPDLEAIRTDFPLETTEIDKPALQLEDLTGDGVPEVLFASMFAGASNYRLRPQAYRWQDGDFRLIFAAGLVSWAGRSDYALESDPTGKGSLQIVLTYPHLYNHGFDHKMINHPAGRQVWRWNPDAEEFVLSEEQVDLEQSGWESGSEPGLPVTAEDRLRWLTNEGEAAFRAGQYEEAIARYEEVLRQAEAVNWQPGADEADWRAYAAFRRAETLLLLGRSVDGLSAMEAVATDMEGDLLGDLARAFLQGYGSGEDPDAAARAVAAMGAVDLYEHFFYERTGALRFPMDAAGILFPGAGLAAYLNAYPDLAGDLPGLHAGLEEIGFAVEEVALLPSGDLRITLRPPGMPHAGQDLVPWLLTEEGGGWRVSLPSNEGGWPTVGIFKFATPTVAEPAATCTDEGRALFTLAVGPDGIQYGTEQTGPMALAVAGDGTFWITDTQGNRLLHYDPQGALLNRIDLNGYGIGIADVEVIGSDVLALVVGYGEQVLRFTASGNLLATYEVPGDLGPEGGLTGLALGDHGQVLLEFEMGAEVVQLVDAQGVLEPVPLAGYPHDGRLYKTQLAGRQTHHGSITVGSNHIEVTVPNILAGMRILGFTPAGGFYVVVDEMVSTPTVAVDQTVRLYGPAGELLGVARVPLAERYTHVQNGLAVGPDDCVYALLTDPDQVKVARLGFSPELEPFLATPVAASRPTAAPTPSSAKTSSTSTSTTLEKTRPPFWRRILFVYNHEGAAELWTVDPAAGQARRQIRPEQQIKDPALSPSGETIAYVYVTGDYGGVPGELWLMDQDGANPRPLYVPPRGQGVFSGTTWQPDGRAIYFVQSGSGAAGSLLRMPAGGSEPTTIVTDCLDFALLPNYELLVGMNLDRQLATFWSDGSRFRTLVPQGSGFGDYFSLAFSPDSRRLAFRGTEGGGQDTWNLYVMNADGTGVRQLTYLTGFDPFVSSTGQVNGLAWTADGAHLVYSVDGHPEQMGIWLVGLDGGPPQRRFVWQEGEWAAVAGPWFEPAPASLPSDADVQRLLDDYARALSSGEVVHPVLYSPAMQDLILDRRAFCQEFSQVADHSTLLGTDSRYTIESVVPDAVEEDVYHVRAVEWLTTTARYRKPTPEEYTPARAALWAMARTDDPAVQAALQDYIDTEISRYSARLNIGASYETVWILRHHLLIRMGDVGLAIIQDTYDDKASDNVHGTDVVDWVDGRFVRQEPDLTTWPDYAMYHEPLEKVERLGQRLLEDYTRRYGSMRTPVVPQ